MSRLITLPMPEAGAEREVYLLRRHNCPNAKVFREIEPDADEVIFPVGLVGEGMPAGVPFVVETSTECQVCGKVLRAWFQWQRPLIFL